MTNHMTERSAGFFVDTDYREQLTLLGLDSVASVFGFTEGQSLTKSNLSVWRQRIRFQLPNGQYAYLKQYNNPPKNVQVKAWSQHGQKAFLSSFDRGPADILEQADVAIPQTIAWGGQWQRLFEKRSFIITLELPNAISLEKQLPDCFHPNASTAFSERKAFIQQLADFVGRFHATGFRHRDLYLAHIFHSATGDLALIDLQRCFKPKLLHERFRIKDLAQLHYSAPCGVISRTDRVRFYRNYRKISKLAATDKDRIRKIHAKAVRIAHHDRKHGRLVPFETKHSPE